MAQSLPAESNGSDSRLQEIVASYLDAVASGQAPGRDRLLQQHADLADELRAFFADHDRMTEAAAPLRRQLAVPDDGTAGAAAKPAHEEFPQSFGDYELLEEIGKGGMGVVYKARHVRLNRIVALKRIRAGQLASPEDMARFQHEARSAAGLDHPHIVPIYEVGDCDGQPFFTMKLQEGGNLGAHLTRYRADPKATAELLVNVARAVHHAHQRGILHRDLKPANLLIDGAGQAHVSDFGLAKRLEEEAKLTRSGAIVGTPEYMAPEQARGEKGLTIAADVYGLGALLYFLLTGQPPFRGDYDWEVLKQVVEDDPPAPRSINRQANRDLEIICLKCLNKDPGRRYASAADLAEDLERWRRGEPIAARPTGRGERLAKWVKRRPAVTALTAATFLAVVIGFGASFTQYLEAVEHADRARQEASEKTVALEKAEESGKTAQRETARAQGEAKLKDVALAEAKRESGLKAEALIKTGKALAEAKRESGLKEEALIKTGKALAAVEVEKAKVKEQFERTRKSLFSARLMHAASLIHRDPARAFALLHDYESCPIDLRDFAWCYYARLCEREKWRRAGLAGHAVSFSPDGQVIAVASNVVGRALQKTAHITLLEASTGKMLATIPTPAHAVTSLVFSPDGRSLVATFPERAADAKKPDEGPRLAWWDLPEGKPKPPLKVALRRINRVAFAPDGKSLLVSGDNVMQRLDLASGEVQATIRLDEAARESAFSKDGTTLLSFSPHSHFVVHDVPTGKQIMTMQRLNGAAIALSPDGRLVATSGDMGEVIIRETATGKERLKFGAFFGNSDTGGISVKSLAFVDNTTLIAASSDEVKFWDVRTAELLATLKIRDEHFSISPDGKWLVTTGTETALWSLARDGAFKTLAFKDAAGLTASPDGITLATVEDRGKIRLHNLATGEERTFDFPESAYNPPRFLSAGKKLLSGKWLWDVASGKLEHTFPSNPSFSPDGDTFAVWSERDDEWVLWDAVTLKKKATWAKTATHGLLIVGPEGKRLAVMSGKQSDGLYGEPYQTDTLEVFDRASRKLLATFGRTWEILGRPTGAKRALFSPDGNHVAMKGYGDTAVVLGDVATGKQTLLEHAQGLSYMVFSPDGKFLITVSWNKNGIKIWDVATGVLVRQLSGALPPLAFSPAGDLLVTAAADGRTAQMWHMETGQLRAELVGHTELIQQITFDPNGRYVATRSKDGAVRIWLGAAPSVHAVFLFGHIAGQSHVSPGGESLAGYDTHFARYIRHPPPRFPDRLHLFDLKTGQLRTAPFENVMRVFTFSPDGTYFACIAGQLRIWNIKTGTGLTVTRGASGAVHKLLFSRDGTLLVVISDQVTVLDAGTGKVRFTILEKLAGSPRPDGYLFSPDGRFVTATNGSEVAIWDVKTGKKVATLEKKLGDIQKLLISPDGRWLLTCTEDVELWDAATGKRAHVLAQKQKVRRLLFSRDGKTLAALVGPGATKSDDVLKPRQVLLWDVASGKALKAPAGHSDDIDHIAISPDGAVLALEGARGSGEIWFWHIEKEELVGRVVLRTAPGATPMHSSWLAFSPDGKTLACADDKKMLFLDTVENRVCGALKLGRFSVYFDSLTFLDNDRLYGFVDERLHVFDVRTAIDGYATLGGFLE